MAVAVYDMHATPQFYVRLARGMLRDRPELARRYLTLRRRRKVLRAAVKRAHHQAIYDSPLADVGFRPPLSVAGCDSLTVVKAEGLELLGVPVAFELDAKGRHRGTPVTQALRRLSAELGRPVSVDELIALYRRYMGACPRMLASHSNQKWAKLPRLIERNRVLVEAAEREMLAACSTRKQDPSWVDAVTASVVLDTSRFMAFVERESLDEVLTAIDWTTASQVVVVGFCPNRGLRMNKRPVATVWGRGEGNAVLKLEDLGSLLHGPGAADGLVGIECLPETWRGWPAGRNQHAPAKTFRYYEAANDA